MLNSFTNFLHASALLIYALLIFRALRAGEEFYTPLILAVFTFTFVLKVLGVLVHVPALEQRVRWRNTLWTLVAVGIFVLNAATLYAIHAPLWALSLGVGLSGALGAYFIYTLRVHVRYAPLAGAFILSYLLAALVTCGALRVGFLLIVFSNVLWIALSKVSYLETKKYHNDIYHVALIGSTYWLYTTIPLGLWEVGACMGGV